VSYRRDGQTDGRLFSFIYIDYSVIVYLCVCEIIMIGLLVTERRILRGHSGQVIVEKSVGYM